MKSFLTCIAAILLFCHCLYSQSDTPLAANIPCLLQIHSIDLSEDMSSMSSKNDEILLMIYKKPTSGKILEAPEYHSSFVLDTLVRKKELAEIKLSTATYLIWLLELDEERPVEQIDPVIRVYWSTILLHHSKKDRAGLSKYLQDNDLLGCFELEINQNFTEKEVELTARQSMDLFHYKLKLSREK